MSPFPYVFPFLFDGIETNLLDHQSDPSLTPYLQFDFTKTGETPYTFYATDRILSLDCHQDPFREDAAIILTNADKYLTDPAIDLKDYTVSIKLGLTVGGTNVYRTLAPQKVTSQSFDSEPGILTCILGCEGIISSLKHDYASRGYFSGGNAKTLVDQILKAELPPFSHCTPYEVVWHGDTGLDSINLYSPSDAFTIDLNTTRLDAIRQLLDLGISFMRPEEDGKIHMRIPKTSGTDYDHEFSLDSHVFFFKTRNKKVLIPNSVTVNCTTTDEWGDEHIYTGTAQDTESIDAYKEVKYFHRAYGLSSHDEALAIAEGILDNIRQNEVYGETEVPVCFYLNVCDYVKITDVREDSETTGNVGYIDWHYSAGKYRQTIGVGGWLNRRKMMNFTQDYIPKPFVLEMPFWIQATLPATKLAAGQWINFQTVLVPNYRRMYINGYSIVGGGVLYILVWSEDSGEWEIIDYLEADEYYAGGPIPTWDAYGETAIAFVVMAEDAVEKVTASVSYNCAYFGGNLP